MARRSPDGANATAPGFAPPRLIVRSSAPLSVFRTRTFDHRCVNPGARLHVTYTCTDERGLCPPVTVRLWERLQASAGRSEYSARVASGKWGGCLRDSHCHGVNEAAARQQRAE